MSRFDAGLLARAASFMTGGTAEPAALPGSPVDLAKAVIRHFEGLYLTPYLCPAGVPSIGYGATFYEDGTRVTLHDAPITRERAEALLDWHIANVYMPGVRALCPHVTDPARLAALIDFTFNLGTGRLRTSTLRKRVNDNRWADVPSELRKWVMAAGKRLAGLVRRREAEVVLVQQETQ